MEDYNEQIGWLLREVRDDGTQSVYTSIDSLQDLIPVARRALIYEVSDSRPRLLLLRPNDEWDPGCGSPIYAEDLDIDGWVASPGPSFQSMICLGRRTTF